MEIGYHKECIECCSKIIEQYENYNIEIDYNLYFNFLFLNYVSLFYYDINKAKQFVHHIMELISINSFIKNEYNKNKTFYDNQFKFAL
jgi:hypothetical protein